MLSDHDIEVFWSQLPPEITRAIRALSAEEDWVSDSYPQTAEKIQALDKKLVKKMPDLSILARIPAAHRLKIGSQMEFGRAMLWLQAQLLAGDEAITPLFEDDDESSKIDKYTLIHRLVILSRYRMLSRLFGEDRTTALVAALQKQKEGKV